MKTTLIITAIIIYLLHQVDINDYRHAQVTSVDMYNKTAQANERV